MRTASSTEFVWGEELPRRNSNRHLVVLTRFCSILWGGILKSTYANKALWLAGRSKRVIFSFYHPWEVSCTAAPSILQKQFFVSLSQVKARKNIAIGRVFSTQEATLKQYNAIILQWGGSVCWVMVAKIFTVNNCQPSMSQLCMWCAKCFISIITIS